MWTLSNGSRIIEIILVVLFCVCMCYSVTKQSRSYHSYTNYDFIGTVSLMTYQLGHHIRSLLSLYMELNLQEVYHMNAAIN